MRGWHRKAGEEREGVACCGRWRTWLLSRGWEAEKTLADQVDQPLQVAYAGFAAPVVEITDEHLDLTLMVGNEGLDVIGVQEFGALGLRQHEVGEGDKTDPAVERQPAEDKGGP